MYTITFYSFKGGVGRTMALVNVAAQLAKMGRKVLLVDFDLEAPGLDTFDRLRPQQPHPGIVEYVTEYRHTHCAPDVRNYIYSAEAAGKKGGQLWVMPAGRGDAQYQSNLAKIDWLQLYREQDGFLLLEDTREQWRQEYEPDYVLIDSRTGHTDVEGICTRQLPDAVVVLFFPNEQNLVGLRDVCRRIRNEQTSGLEKSIRLHFAMSNVPDLDDENQDLYRLRKRFRKDLGYGKLDAIIYRYESVMLFNQAIFVLKRPNSRLAREYRHLVRRLMMYNFADRDGALLFLRQYYSQYLRDTYPTLEALKRQIPGGYHPSGVPDAAGDPTSQICTSFPDDPEISEAIKKCNLEAFDWQCQLEDEENQSESPGQQG